MKLRKKTLLIAGSLSIALGFSISSHVWAQPPASPPVSATQQQDEAPSTLDGSSSVVPEFNKSSGSAPSHPQIEFKNYTSYDELLKLFPGAREIVEKYGDKSEAPLVMKQGSFARVSDNLYIYWSEQSEDCGMRGCTAITFSSDEDSFYPSATITTTIPPTEYEIDKYGEPSIFTCTADFKLIEWKRRDGLSMTGVESTTENCAPYLEPEAPKP